MLDRHNAKEWFGERLSEEDRAEMETFLDSTFGEYDDFVESSKASRQEWEDRHAADQAEINALKAKNFDLLMQVPNDNGAEGMPQDPYVDDDGEVYHIADLFETKEVR